MLKSAYVDVEGHRVHYWHGGTGFPILMLHGVGPGTSIVGNFAPVLEPLAERCEIVATDLIGFGQSDRKREPPYFDVDLWLRQAAEMLELLPSGPCGVIGHSLGGALALKLAGRTPRIQRVLTSSTIGAPYPLNSALDGFWSVPKDRDALRRSMERMVHRSNLLTEEMIDDRWALLESPGYADYLAGLFAPPRQQYIDAAVLNAEELGRIDATVVMLHGWDDQPCPYDATTLAIAKALKHADVHLLASCGHNLPRERKQDYLRVARDLFGPEPPEQR